MALITYLNLPMSSWLSACLSVSPSGCAYEQVDLSNYKSIFDSSLFALLPLWFNSDYQFHLQYLPIPLPLRNKAANRLKRRFKTNQTCRVFHLLRVSTTFLFILLSPCFACLYSCSGSGSFSSSSSSSVFFHSFLLFCVSRARIKIVFVCGSACWFRLLSEMWNAKWEMENATRGQERSVASGGGGSKKKGKTYYVCYYNAISFVFLFGLRFALLWTFSLNFSALASLKCRLPLPRPRLCHRPSVVGAVAKLKYHKFELITVE